jgi:hypothetical protein
MMRVSCAPRISTADTIGAGTTCASTEGAPSNEPATKAAANDLPLIS